MFARRMLLRLTAGLVASGFLGRSATAQTVLDAAALRHRLGMDLVHCEQACADQRGKPAKAPDGGAREQRKRLDLSCGRGRQPLPDPLQVRSPGAPEAAFGAATPASDRTLR